MPARNLYLSPGAEEALGARSRGGVGSQGDRSAVVSRMLERYAEVCGRSLPDLSEDEWSLIYAACQGWFVDTPQAVRYLPMEVADYAEDTDDGEGMDVHDLVAKLEALDYAGRLAVVDAAERYWVRPRE